MAHETLDHTADGWLGLRDAASALGLSVHAVRRRLRSGELTGHQVETKFGRAWLVQVQGIDGTAPPSQPLRSPGDTPSATPHEGENDAGLAGLVELVRELQGEVVRRTEVAATWQARAEFLAGQLEASRDEVKSLMAPASTLTASTTAESAEPTTGPSPARWRTSAPWVLLVVILLLAFAVGHPAWVR